MSCSFLSAEHLDEPICVEGLKDLGTSPGCGGVSLIEEGQDVVARILDISRFFMKEQCGLCPPCRMETNQIVHILQAALDKKEPAYEQKLRKLTDFARGKGRCSLIEMAAAPVLSALELFPADFAS
jgi:NADH-quinone oxidoreductase subunit F